MPRSIFKKTPPRAKNGLLIAIEGLDGAGKTTTVQRVIAGWKACPVLLTNWNETRELYNLMMRLNAEVGLDGDTRCLLGAAELAARYEYRILPALERGEMVFANKYLISAMAHSLIRGQDRAFVERIYSFAIPADATIYFDLDAEVALDRKRKANESIGFWEAGLDVGHDEPLVETIRKYREGIFDDAQLAARFVSFQRALQDLHRKELATSSSRVIVVDSMQPPDEVVQTLTRFLASLYSGTVSR